MNRDEEVKLAMLGDAHAKLKPREKVLEFKGEYLGGHVKFPNRCNIILQLGDEIYVAPYPPLSDPRLNKPFMEIPYEDISNIQSLPNEKIDTLRVLTVGLIGGLLWRKKEFFLTLTFKDDLDINQTVCFKMQNIEEAQRAIYYKLAEAKKKKKKGASKPK